MQLPLVIPIKDYMPSFKVNHSYNVCWDDNKKLGTKVYYSICKYTVSTCVHICNVSFGNCLFCACGLVLDLVTDLASNLFMFVTCLDSIFL